jgi:hypothetical protein
MIGRNFLPLTVNKINPLISRLLPKIEPVYLYLLRRLEPFGTAVSKKLIEFIWRVDPSYFNLTEKLRGF